MTGIKLLIKPVEGRGLEAERRAVKAAIEDELSGRLGHYSDGAPFVEGREDVAISVSHGAGYAVVALVFDTSVRMGVDVEGFDRMTQLKRVKERFVSHEDDEATLSLLQIWTAKEAVYKASRHPGLPLSAIAVKASFADALGFRYLLEWQQIGDTALICTACSFNT